MAVGMAQACGNGESQVEAVGGVEAKKGRCFGRGGFQQSAGFGGSGAQGLRFEGDIINGGVIGDVGAVKIGKRLDERLLVKLQGAGGLAAVFVKNAGFDE